MSNDPNTIVFTVKELLQRLDERLSQVDQKLDLRLSQIDDRLLHVEREQAARVHLIDEHRAMKVEVESLKAFRARFLPTTIIVAVIALLALGFDIYVRAF
jgi:hypothetical protein